MITLGFVLAGAMNLALPLEDIQYQRMVEIVKVQVNPSKEARRHDLEITFNLVPDMPKGVKIFFELERDQLPVTDESSSPVSYAYSLENDNRKNIKVTWTPKARLTCDKYTFKTKIPLAEQSEEVKKTILANTKRFPDKSDPWAWSHVNQEFTVGDPAQEAAEYKEVKAFMEGKAEAILDLNNDAMSEFEKVTSGQAHVKAGKLDVDSLRKFLAGWMGRMAKLQTAISEVLVIDPGLYDSKYHKIHADLITLGQMIAKRISKTEAKKVLDKYGVPLTSLKLPAVSGFRADYNFATTVSEIDKRQKSLKRTLWYAEPGRKDTDIYKDPDEESTDAAGDSKDGKDAKKDEPKEAGDSPKEPGDEASTDDPAKTDPPAKKDTKKPTKKDSKKKK